MPQNKKEAKRLYDIEYRRKNRKRIALAKKAYEQTPAGRSMQKRNRLKFREQHLEYCRTPKYRRWKKKYDQCYRAKKLAGEFWECLILCEKIRKEVIRACPDHYEREKMRGVIARIQARQAAKRAIKLGWNYNWGHILRGARDGVRGAGGNANQREVRNEN